MSFISNLRNWAAQRMAVGPGQDSGTGLYLQDTANYFAGTSVGANVYETAAVEFAVASSGGLRWRLRSRSVGQRWTRTRWPAYSGRRSCLGESVQLIDLNRRTGRSGCCP